MKPRYIIGSVIAVVFLAIGFFALNNTGVPYTDLKTAGDLKSKVQIKGTWVKEEATNYDSQNNLFSFSMKDDSNNVIKVQFAGAKPNNFELAQSLVVKGKVDKGVFYASDILTKCPSKYEGSGGVHPEGAEKKPL